MDIDSCRMATVASLLVPSNIVEDIVSVLIAVIKELKKMPHNTQVIALQYRTRTLAFTPLKPWKTNLQHKSSPSRHACHVQWSHTVHHLFGWRDGLQPFLHSRPG